MVTHATAFKTSRVRWFPLALGAVVAALGIVLMLNPSGIMGFITWLIAAALVCNGVRNILRFAKTASATPDYPLLVKAGIDIAFAVFLVVLGQGVVSAILGIAIGLWALISGACRLYDCFRMRKAGKTTANWQVILSVVSILGGIAVIVLPITTWLNLTSIAGIIVAFIGVTMLTRAFQSKGMA